MDIQLFNPPLHPLSIPSPIRPLQAVGYAYSPLLANLETKAKESAEEAGFLVFIISKDIKEVQPQAQQIVDGLHQMLTNKNPQFQWGFRDVESTSQVE